MKKAITAHEVVVRAKTADKEGAESVGPFKVYLCGDLDHCVKDSPIWLTPISCNAQANCMARGEDHRWVEVISVPKGFTFHEVEIEAETDDEWSIDMMYVNFDGEVAHHDAKATLTNKKVFLFGMGCLTLPPEFVGGTAVAGSSCVTECYEGWGPYGYCFTDRKKKTSGPWGPCNSHCSTHRKESVTTSGKGEKSVESCAELNWPTMSTYNKDRSVCGTSSAFPLPGCQSERVGWEAAKAVCEQVGSRLCTADELRADETAGSGCGLDEHAIWSSTPCTRGYQGTGFKTLPGRWFYRNIQAEACHAPASPQAYSRCCADARYLRIVFTREQNEHHSLPARMEVSSSGGLMNWEVVHGERFDGSYGYYLQSGMTHWDRPWDNEFVHIFMRRVPVAARGGEITFYYKVSAEPRHDFLHFYIDGAEATRNNFPVSGKHPWTFVSFAFPAFPSQRFHDFRWTYKKDSSNSYGADVAWIDDLRVYGVVGND